MLLPKNRKTINEQIITDHNARVHKKIEISVEQGTEIIKNQSVHKKNLDQMGSNMCFFNLE